MSFLFKVDNRLLEPVFTGNVGVSLCNGKDSLFWEIPWCGPNCIKQHFPNLYPLSTNKFISVAESVDGMEGSGGGAFWC